jgi:hypothetical protein
MAWILISTYNKYNINHVLEMFNNVKNSSLGECMVEWLILKKKVHTKSILQYYISNLIWYN